MTSVVPRRAILGILAALAAGPAACSKGGDKAPDAGPTGEGGASAGSGGASAGSGGASAGSGGSAVAGAGGAAAGTAGGGGAGAAGTGGRPAGTCTFDVQHTQSPVIGTVEIVTFSLDVADLTEAHIDFGPSGAAPTMTAPVDLRAPLHRTALLGMKGQKPYTFRVVATDGTKTCTSADVSLTTGAAPAGAPKIVKTTPGTGAARGFILTTTGVDVGSSHGQPDAYIFDTDGDVVWWTYAGLYTSSANISRAHLSWDGKSVWLMTAMSAKLVNVSIDGVAMTDYTNVVKGVHHDLTPLPDGAIATMISVTGKTAHSIIEVKPDGTITTVIADLSTLYPMGSYPNSIHYYAADDSYTLSDRTGNLYVKFKRNGALVWQLGGSNPVGKSFALVGLGQWQVNHGHHLTPDGRFVFFNNYGTSGASTETPWVWELQLDEAAGTATKTWQYHFSTGVAVALGDAQLLPNGNVLVTNSMYGLIQEIDHSGAIVRSFQNTTFGYVDFRTSLYGPPPR